MFQVGDHHPDLYVWTLYNHHEVSLCFCSHFQPKATTCFIRTIGRIFMCCALCRFNRSLCCLVERHCSRAGQPCLSGLRRTTAVGNAGDGDNDMVPLKQGEKGRVCTCARVHPKQDTVCQASEQHPADLVTQFKLSVKSFLCSPGDFQLAEIELDHFDEQKLFSTLSLTLCPFCPPLYLLLSPAKHFSAFLPSVPKTHVWWPVRIQGS